MSEPFAPHERELCQMFAEAAHGPKRNGFFALWLILRVTGDTLTPSPFSERARRRRAEALARRLGSLTLPASLGTAVRDAAQLIGQQPSPRASNILLDLAPRVRETLGARAASLLVAAADRVSDSKVGDHT